MGELSHNSDLLARYLLGDLPVAEQELLEEEYFSNDELFLELLDAKDQLTSDYLGDRLAPADRLGFERKFLTQPDCRQDVELDWFLQPASVRSSLTQPPAPREKTPPWWQTIFIALRPNRPLAGAAVAALLITSAVGIWSALHSSPEKSSTDLARTSPPTPVGPIIVSLPVKAGRLRSGGETPTAFVAANTQTVELQLEVNRENYSRYHASLQRTDETVPEVMADSALNAEAAAGKPLTVIWKLPTAKLSIGDYQVKLSGIGMDNSTDYIGAYDFKIRNQ